MKGPQVMLMTKVRNGFSDCSNKIVKSLNESNKKVIKPTIEKILDAVDTSKNKIVTFFCSVLNRKQVELFQKKGFLPLAVKIICKTKNAISFDEIEGNTTYQIKAERVDDDINVGDIIQPIR